MLKKVPENKNHYTNNSFDSDDGDDDDDGDGDDVVYST